MIRIIGGAVGRAGLLPSSNRGAGHGETFETSQPLMSWLNSVAPSNMPDMSFTLLVSQPPMS